MSLEVNVLDVKELLAISVDGQKRPSTGGPAAFQLLAGIRQASI